MTMLEYPCGDHQEAGLSEGDRVERTITDAVQWLVKRQEQDGHWVFELEADATIPAEYIFLNHFLGEPNDEIEGKLARYLRRIQNAEGGWPLFNGGDTDLSATVKAYYALKIVGDDVDAPHMARARRTILAMGGAERSNVFTRIALAIFCQVPWRAVPIMPVELMLLPKWFFFHIEKVSYWSRTVLTPLLILKAKRAKARNPRNVNISELFVTPPWQIKNYISSPTGEFLGEVFVAIDKVLRLTEPHFPKWLRKKAIKKTVDYFTERLNGEDGLGAIFPAMANAVMAYDVLGYERDHPDYVIARQSIDKLLVFNDDEGYCQPCLSPVWDTGLAAHALLEAGGAEAEGAARRGLDWLVERQILDVVGDWASNRPGVRPGGWAFQYWNDYYPDVDDTAVVGMAMDRTGDESYRRSIERAAEWIEGMQSSNGGWGAFDADNEYYMLEHIPFADHGALLDPPTLDVSARCVGFLAQLGYDRKHPIMARALDYIHREQMPDGSWFGRWGTNYIYGTWSALAALNAAGDDMEGPHIQRAIAWLKSRQREDGGWGEDCATYWPGREQECKQSLPSQTAWALLALMAAGEVDCDEVARGVEYLVNAPHDGGKWTEELFNAVGFPRVFYLRYHGYSAYFPLWALARYRNLRRGNSKRPAVGL